MKPADIFHFNRPWADRLTQALARTPLKPNHITSLSLLAGVGAGAAAAQGSTIAMLATAALMHARFILDNCDGTLARLKGLSSSFGMWYDLVADVVADLFFWGGLALGARSRGAGPEAFIWAAAAAVGCLILFGRVIAERVGTRRAAVQQASGRNEVVSTLYLLNHDGDPSLLLWLAAPLAGPYGLLIMGAVYMQVIWISSVLFSRSALWRL